MLTYHINRHGKEPIYQALYQAIRNDIQLGKLLPDEKLPSKRAFSKHLGISTITVENAYNQLLAEGYIYSIPKSGFYVSDIEPMVRERTREASGSPASFLKEDSCTLGQQVKEQAPEIFADFSNNSICTKNFPFSIWTKLFRETMAENQEKLLARSPSCGIHELRVAIANYLYGFRGMDVSPEQIVVGAGTEYLYSLLIQLLGRSHIFAIEDPGYHKVARIYEANKVKVQYISTGKEGIDLPELFQSQASIVHLSPSHHFPTGIVTPIQTRMQLLRWASEQPERYIIEDDYDSEFRMLGRPVPTMQSIDQSDKVIYMNTFTKTLSPTIRISYMVLPKSLISTFHEKLGFYSCTVSNFEQYTLAKFMEQGYFEKHINRMRTYYKNVRNTFLECIKKQNNPKVHILEEHAGLHFLLKIDTDLSDEALSKRALEQGLKLSFLSQFYQNKEQAPEHIMLINYSAMETSKINETIERLWKALDFTSF